MKKPGSEHGGDKVWTNFNGSGVDVDGMGGEGGDFLAARVGGYALNKQVESLPANCSIDEAAKAIRRGFIDAGHAIREGRKKEGEFGGMDAVGDAVKICTSADNKRLFLVLGHVGDAKTCVYRAETGKLEKVTTDHTLVQRLVDANVITKADAFLHPDRNVVTRGMGNINEGNVDNILELKVVELLPGDFVITSSDGLGDNIELSIIQKIITESPEALERIHKNGWPSGFAMHLAETAHGIMKRNTELQAKSDDVSVLIIAPHLI